MTAERIERLTKERDEAIKYRDDEFALRDALSNENTRLRAALERIAAIRYGLEMTDSDEEHLAYWRDLALEYRRIAREALRPAGG